MDKGIYSKKTSNNEYDLSDKHTGKLTLTVSAEMQKEETLLSKVPIECNHCRPKERRVAHPLIAGRWFDSLSSCLRVLEQDIELQVSPDG